MGKPGHRSAKGKGEKQAEPKSVQVKAMVTPTDRRLLDWVRIVTGESFADLIARWVRAEARNLVRRDIEEPETIAGLVSRNWVVLVEDAAIELSRLEELRSGDAPTDADIVMLSVALDLTEEYLRGLNGYNHVST